MLLEDNPLKARPRKKNRKPKSNKDVERDFQEMEQKFEPYSSYKGMTKQNKTKQNKTKN